MKATLTFNLPEEGTEFEACSNGMEYKCKLEEVWESLFRPRHKHGYNNPVINMLLSSESDEDPCHKLMDELEKLYREVIRDE